MTEEWRYASAPATWLSDTALLAVLGPPAQFCDAVLLLWATLEDQLLNEALNKKSQGALRRSLAEISALLAKTHYLLIML